VKYLYLPLLKELELPQKTIKNAAHSDPLINALFTGQVNYSAGTFYGKFNAAISKRLRELGATFDRKTSTYKLKESELPIEIRNVISASKVRFEEKMKKLDDKLAKIIPEELAEQFKCADIFDKTLWKADRDFSKNVKKITVAPQLTDAQRKKIADEWQNNMKLWIRGWTEDQIKELRKNIFEDVMKGTRRDAHVPAIFEVTKTIQKSHEKAVNKAKFLAHQETRLLMAKFKEVRYTEVGFHEYIWRTVHRPVDSSPDHHTLGNVRYSHGQLNNKIFRWDNPPVSTNPGEPARKNNPGQDYNCRCFARPIKRKPK
jgi:uncharacterized protein with gpF-like domain